MPTSMCEKNQPDDGQPIDCLQPVGFFILTNRFNIGLVRLLTDHFSGCLKTALAKGI